MEPHFFNGLRVTDEPTMEIAEMVLNKVNKSLVSMIEELGVKACGISGKDGGMLKVDKKLSGGEDIGYVGEVKEVDTTLLHTLLKDDFLPVICPIGYDDNFHAYILMPMMRHVPLQEQLTQKSWHSLRILRAFTEITTTSLP